MAWGVAGYANFSIICSQYQLIFYNAMFFVVAVVFFLYTINHQLRARRVLILSNKVPLRTRRALSPKTLYNNSPLLVLNRKSLDSVNALLALNGYDLRSFLPRYLAQNSMMNGTFISSIDNFKCH